MTILMIMTWDPLQGGRWKRVLGGWRPGFPWTIKPTHCKMEVVIPGYICCNISIYCLQLYNWRPEEAGFPCIIKPDHSVDICWFFVTWKLLWNKWNVLKYWYIAQLLILISLEKILSRRDARIYYVFAMAKLVFNYWLVQPHSQNNKNFAVLHFYTKETATTYSWWKD